MESKHLHPRRLCLEQALSFITAAEALDAAIWPHIVYHLSLLALEEVGKANMLSGRAVAGDRFDGGLIDRSLTSHRRKLQWAVWSPTRRMDPADFHAARDFAERAHSRRLNALYVDPSADPLQLPPAQQVQADDALRALALARARHDYEAAVGEPAEPDELAEWFLDTAADAQASPRLFSRSFIAKYEELGGDVRTWAAWAREEFARIDAELVGAMERELTRPSSPVGEGKPRWRAKATVYTPSHSLRSKVLARWNSQLDAIQLLWIGKKDQLTLQIILGDDVPIGELTSRLTSLGKLTVACLNMGSIGYFWFERPGFEQKMFKEILDLEQGMDLAMKGGESFWGDGRAVALTEEHIDHALHCMLAYAPLPEAEAAPIFSPYFDGLAFIAKSDIFYDLNELARQAFAASLAGALRRFGGWSGQQEDLEAVFDEGFSAFMPEPEHRARMMKCITRQGDPNESSLVNLRSAKQLADLYLIHTARRLCRETMADKAGLAVPS